LRGAATVYRIAMGGAAGESNICVMMAGHHA
jgi:hypothetical protein